MTSYPAAPSARNTYILEQRGLRTEPDPWQFHAVTAEDERTSGGTIARVGTVFLTGHECRWRCVMCDLWRQTTTAVTPPGAIPAQVAAARRALATNKPTQLKLYNAASFFDPDAVPDDDYAPIARALDGLERVIAESHPALIGTRVDRLLDALGAAATNVQPPALEVAMGLETAHPGALEQLNKRMTVQMFNDAAGALKERRVDVRAFVLVYPPFIPVAEQDEWLRRSMHTAFAAGASVVSLIPTRSGNGAIDRLAEAGSFRGPRLDDIERSIELALALRQQQRVFADLWDLERFSRCEHCLGARVSRLHHINLTQDLAPPIVCRQCHAGALA